MKELKHFNFCYLKEIDKLFLQAIFSDLSNFFEYTTNKELIDLLNREKIHLVIIKYDLELIKEIKKINNQIQIVAFLEKIDSSYLLDVLHLGNIKLIDNLEKIEDFIKTMKISIKNIDSNKSNIFTLENDFVYDKYNKTLFKKDILIHLSKKESIFFDFLFSNLNLPISFEKMNEEIWDGEMTQDALRSVIKEIRKKTYKDLIKSVSGIGYKINA